MPGVVAEPQRGHEAARLLEPVEDQRARRDDQRRPAAGAPARCPAPGEQGQHLHRLAQPHVVGEAAAEPELAQELEPAQPLRLVTAQRSDEAGRRVRRRDPREAREPGAQPLERRVARGLRQRGQQRVEQHGLAPRKADPVPLDPPELAERREAREPVLGEHAEAPVAEPDHPLPAPQRGEQLRERHLRVVEARRAVELEPVDPRRDRDREPAGGAVAQALGFDLPPRDQERRDDRREPTRGDRGVHRRATAPARRLTPPAVRRERVERGALGLEVAHDEPPARARDRRRRVIAGDLLPVVRERDLGREPLARTPFSRRPHAQPRLRPGAQFAVRQVLREFHPRTGRQREQCLDQLRRLARGQGQRRLADQVQQQRQRVPDTQARDPAAGDHEAGEVNQRQLRQRNGLVAANQRAGEQVVGAAPGRAQRELQLPGRPLVPDEGRRLVPRRRGLEPQAARLAEQRQDQLEQPFVQTRASRNRQAPVRVVVAGDPAAGTRVLLDQQRDQAAIVPAERCQLGPGEPNRARLAPRAVGAPQPALGLEHEVRAAK